MDGPTQDLLRRMNVTKGSRFNAAKRLEGRDRKMALLTALASALVVALTFIPFAYKLPQVVIADLSVVTMLASVLILAVSLIQYSNNDSVNAEQHHRCGLEINDLRGELSAKGDNVDADELRRFTERYARVLDKYSVNHDNIDFDRYRLEHSEAYELRILEKLAIYIRGIVKAHWPNFIMAGIVVFFALLVVVHVLPVRLAVEPTPIPKLISPQSD